MEHVHKTLHHLGYRSVVPLLTEHLTLPVNVYSRQNEHHCEGCKKVSRGPDPVRKSIVTFYEVGSRYFVEATEHVRNNEGSLKCTHEGNGGYYGKESHVYQIRCVTAPTKQSLFSHGHGQNHGLDTVEDLRKPDSLGCQ